MSDARADFELAVHDAVHAHFEIACKTVISGERGDQRITLFGSGGIPKRVADSIPHWHLSTCPEIVP